jgi:hypothetical protein
METNAMTAVANCPRCEHELLIPARTDIAAWAKCPTCQAFFQVRDALRRDVPEILLVAPPSSDPADEAISPSTTSVEDWSEHESSRLDSEQISTGLEVDEPLLPEQSAAEEPQSAESAEAAAQQIDKLFCSAQTVADIPLPSAETTIALPKDADFEVEQADLDRPTWDDSERMERLLADVEAAPMPTGWPGTEETVETDDAEVVPPIVVASARGRHQRKSLSLAGLVTGGLGGLAAGYYVLLWILGRDGDFLQASRFIPAALLPDSFQSSPAQLAADTHSTTPATGKIAQPTAEKKTSTIDDSAEVTASYETPAASPTEPTEFEDLTATPLASPEAIIHNAPAYSLAQLAAGLEAAQAALPGLVDGDLGDKSVQRTKGLSFTKLSYLAELVTFVDSQSRPAETQALLQEAEHLFGDILARPKTRNEVAYITSKWLDSPHRRFGGLFLAGIVTKQSSGVAVVEYQLDMGAGNLLTVLARDSVIERLAGSGQPVGVVGSVIDHPAERISGYTGTAPRAVWAGMLIPLE